MSPNTPNRSIEANTNTCHIKDVVFVLLTKPYISIDSFKNNTVIKKITVRKKATHVISPVRGNNDSPMLVELMDKRVNIPSKYMNADSKVEEAKKIQPAATIKKVRKD